jgi:hypothetical protein
LIVFATLVAGVSAAQAAGPMHPVGVPADFVATPFGYFHPSCINHLANDDILQQDASAILRADGISEPISACAYPHFKADGEKVIGDERAAGPPSISHAWVEDWSVKTTTSYWLLQAYWNVPPKPSANDGQVLYFFPGFEDDNDVETVIQPVLGWNQTSSGQAWTIASWNCCIKGTVQESTPASANPGDVIRGLLYNTCSAGTLSCGSWNIWTIDLTNGKSTALKSTSSFGQTFNWAFAGVLEVYNVAQCSDYPQTNSTKYPYTVFSTSFYDVSLYDYEHNLVSSPAWTIAKSSTVTPQCTYGGARANEVTLTY